MKKSLMTIIIVFLLTMVSFAESNHGGGLFQRGANTRDISNQGGIMTPGLPNHGESGDQDAPLDTGIATLTALGAAYLIIKRNKQD